MLLLLKPKLGRFVRVGGGIAFVQAIICSLHIMLTQILPGTYWYRVGITYQVGISSYLTKEKFNFRMKSDISYPKSKENETQHLFSWYLNWLMLVRRCYC